MFETFSKHRKSKSKIGKMHVSVLYLSFPTGAMSHVWPLFCLYIWHHLVDVVSQVSVTHYSIHGSYGF